MVRSNLKVLFDIVHPTDVHFFKRCIHSLLQRGDHIVVTSRQKDVTSELLDALGIGYTTISRLGHTRVDLFLELWTRDFKLWSIARRCKPDIFVSNNSPCGAHIARIMQRPSLVFEDTETHRYNHWLYYPFVTEIHSPRCYPCSLGRKQHFYQGYSALAYLHPKHFQPDPDVLRLTGFNPAEPMILIRFVGWKAMHDFGRKRLSAEDRYRLVQFAKQYANVFISSETPLPDELKPYRLEFPVAEIHHLLYYANLLIGDSGSMTSEAAVLGTPAIYCDDIGLGYTDEQQTKYGLCFHFKPFGIELICRKIEELMSLHATHHHFSEARARLLHDTIDVAAYQLEQIDRLASGTCS